VRIVKYTWLSLYRLAHHAMMPSSLRVSATMTMGGPDAARRECYCRPQHPQSGTPIQEFSTTTCAFAKLHFRQIITPYPCLLALCYNSRLVHSTFHLFVFFIIESLQHCKVRAQQPSKPCFR